MNVGLEPRKRLDREDWVKAALEVLVHQSVDSVGVEPLARSLNVSKGSFYWHFKDREDLLAAVIDYWRDNATRNVIRYVEAKGDGPVHKLHLLSKIAIDMSPANPLARMEVAIRAWARRDARVRVVLTECDRERMAYLAKLFQDCGLDEGEAEARGALLFGFAVGERNIFRDEAKRAQRGRLDRLLHFLIDEPVVQAKPKGRARKAAPTEAPKTAPTAVRKPRSPNRPKTAKSEA
jgi:AcrR family transcriptional regulator